MRIRPCPFCGGTDVAIKQDPVLWCGHRYWFIEHYAPNCTITNAFGLYKSSCFTTKKRATEAWNKRVGDDLMERMVDDGK